jgi:(E)-4-hydroxy-3-methylbut-2-enyl-diphosphate synthase
MRKTREVKVGFVGIGANNPVRIQSMTTSNTRDAEATVAQIMKLADAGCEIARITVQGIKEADTCEEIKNTLVQKGYNIPLVADIHFFPPAAMRVVDFVEKVRVNPGNFADKRASFKTIEYTDETYAEELVRIEEKFAPLVEKCRKLGRAMRIGTNHGSLSDRIMNRYGDTPAGMVESAFEFARICRKYDYHDLIFSMKSSNPKVMIEAYRLLVAEMEKIGWDYPLHLGVTEAGQGEDGRVKSAMGIGALLLEGIGDTIRVSLTEDAWLEIDPCTRLRDFAAHYPKAPVGSRKTRLIQWPKDVALHKDGSVILPIDEVDFIQLGCEMKNNQPMITRSSVDAILSNEPHPDLSAIGIGVYGATTPILTLQDAEQAERIARFQVGQTIAPYALKVVDEHNWERINQLHPRVIFLALSQDRLAMARKFFAQLKLNVPVILNFAYACSYEDLVIQASAECGALLCDGYGEGLCLETDIDPGKVRELSFNILQAARMRTTKTEFISCPSCGRTLFDLQDVSKRIIARTQHLPGVKLAIMGCIVNGPGEMADADFGYVGSRPGKIDLYVGKECVEKNIDFADADDRLVELIKSHGRWVEPNTTAIEMITS